MANKLYPLLTQLTNVEQLPENLTFVKEGITTVLDKIYFRNLRVSKSIGGDSVSYDLELVCDKKLGFEVFGTGISIALNPDFTQNTDYTIIPISLSFKLGIKRFIKNFKLSNIPFDPNYFFDLIFGILKLSDERLLRITVGNCIDDATPYNVFAEHLNTVYGTSNGINIIIPVSSDNNIAVQDILSAINGSSPLLSLREVVFTDYILDTDDLEASFENINKLFASASGKDKVIEFIKDLFIPVISAKVSTNLGIEFPRKYLVPINIVGEVTTDENIKTILIFDIAELNYSTKGGFGIDKDLSLSFPPQYPNAQIANTGLTVGFTNAKFDFSRNSSIPEAAAAGYGDDFIGVFVEEAIIGLPQFWKKDEDSSTAEIFGQNMLIGTGGISGIIGMRAKEGATGTPLIATTFGDDGFSIGLDTFSLQFRQNAIIGSNIKGTLTIPGFNELDEEGDIIGPAEIGVEVNIVSGGDFSVTASSLTKGLKIAIPNVLAFTLRQVEVGKKGDRYYLSVTGKMDFMVAELEGILPKALDITDLIIWSDGQIELPKGGSLKLPKTLKMKFGPAEFTVTAIHLGSEERFRNGKMNKYKYFGFDGGLNVNPGGVDAKGSGIKFYFNVADPSDFFIRLESLAIDITIPGSASKDAIVARISGFLSIKQDPEGRDEYSGGVSIDLPKLKMSGSAAMRMKPSVPSFIVDVALELPKPIPLGPTGMGIYGFRGLFGSKYVADKEPHVGKEGKWYDYYKLKVEPTYREGIEVNKFTAKDGFTVGAGVSIASAFDSGKVLSAKVMFILSPSLFYLEGQMGILKERVKLTDTKDLPFFVILKIDDDSVYAAFGVNYKMPEDTGAILTVAGKAEIEFFFKNANAWYIHIGAKADPIKANVLSFLSANAYLEISAKGIEFGAGVTYDIAFGSKRFGIRGSIHFEIGAMISFKPLVLGGYGILSGGVELNILGIGLIVDLYAKVSISAPRPVIVVGMISASGCVRWFGGKKCLTLSFQFKKVFGSPAKPEPIELLNIDSGVSAINMLTDEAFPVKIIKNGAISSGLPADLDNYVIPMDSYISLEFIKGMTSRSSDPSLNKIAWEIGTGGYTELIPPAEGNDNQIEHTYSLEALNIYARDANEPSQAWEAYDVYNALVPEEADELINATVVGSLKHSAWQVDSSKRQSKLVVLSASPFNYIQNGTDGPILEYLGLSVENLTCGGPKREEYCHAPSEKNIPIFFAGKKYIFPTSGMELVSTKDAALKPVVQPYVGAVDALQIKDGNSISLVFPVASNQITLRLITKNRIKVSYYTKVIISGQTGLIGEVLSAEELFKTIELTAVQAVQPLVYAAEETAVTRIVIEDLPSADTVPLVCKPNAQNIGYLLTMLNGLQGIGHWTEADPSLEWETDVFDFLPLDFEGSHLKLWYEGTGFKSWTIHFDAYKTVFGYSLTLKVGNLVFQFSRATKIDSFLNHFVDEFNLQFINKAYATKSSSREITIDSLSADIESISVSSFNYFRSEPSILENVIPVFPWADVESFSNVLPSGTYDVEGANYNFKVTATLTGGATATLYGSTDNIPVICCSGSSNVYYDALCTEVDKQITVLENKIVELIKLINQYTLIWVSLQDDSDPDCYRTGEGYYKQIQTLTTEKTDLETQVATLKTWKENNCGNTSGGVCGSGSNLPVLEGSYLVKVCWLKQKDYIYNQNLPTSVDAQRETDTFIKTISKSIQPIWRANTAYAIEVKTKEAFKYKGKGIGDHVDSYWVYFRTRGPVGHFHQTIHGSEDSNAIKRVDYRREYDYLLTHHQEDQYKLASLKHYIDYQKSYPNADGSLVSAKPMYYKGPKLYLFFRKNYVKSMLNGFRAIDDLDALPFASNQFKMFISDPASTDRLEIEMEKQSFKPNTRPFLSKDMEYMLNILNNNPCSTATVNQPKGLHYEVDLEQKLSPSKLYTAVFEAIYLGNAASVHRYNFQTSQYGNFEEHVQSYRMVVDPETKEEKLAFYDLKLSNVGKVSAEQYNIEEIFGVIDNDLLSTSPLVTAFMDPYDRLITGAMKITALEEALTTEVNFVRDYNLDVATSDQLIGILIRSPEPFNNPKIDEDIRKAAVRVLDGDGMEITGFDEVIISKDSAKIFISNTNHNVTQRSLQIQLDYLKYDPEQGYLVSGSQKIVIDKVPIYKTALIATHCGATELALNATVQAYEVEDLLLGKASEYTFNIHNSEIDETISNALPEFALGSLGLKYNRTYEVKVKATLAGRAIVYGETCNISTKKLTFKIANTLPAHKNLGDTLELNLALQFNDTSVLTSYTGNVKLELEIDSTTTPHTIAFVKGKASFSTVLDEGGELKIRLVDIDETGYDVQDEMTIIVTEPATKWAITPMTDPLDVNTNHTVTIQALSDEDVLDITYSGQVNLTITGAATQLVTVTNGIGTAQITSNRSRLATISTSNVLGASNPLLGATPITVVFIDARLDIYTLEAIATAAVNTDVVITLKVKDQAILLWDSVWEIPLGLKITRGAGVEHVVVPMSYGVGTYALQSSVAELVEVEIEEITSSASQIEAPEPYQITFTA